MRYRAPYGANNDTCYNVMLLAMLKMLTCETIYVMGALDKFVPHMFFDLGLVGDGRVQEAGSSGNRLQQDNCGLEAR